MAGHRGRARTSPIGIQARSGASAVAMKVSEVFRRITVALDQAGIPYMLTGSFASAFYGVPRSSQDIDLIIEATPTQLQTFIQLLPSGEYYADLEMALKAQKRQSLFNVIDLLTGWKVYASRSCIATAGGVNPVARCQILRCTTGNSAAIREPTQRKT